MKKNELLTYNDKKKKLTKKNYIIIIVPIVLVIILIIAIAFYVFSYSNSSNKLKRYLIDNQYTCNKQICTKEEDNNIYTIYYNDMNYVVENNEYSLTINDSSFPTLELKNSDYICTYTKPSYESFTHIDTSFIHDRKCTEYISDINKNIDLFKNILENSKVM